MDKKVPFENFSKKVLVVGKKKDNLLHSLFEVENFLNNSKKVSKAWGLYKLLK